MSFIRRRSKKTSHAGGSILKKNNKPNLARSPSLSTLPVSGLPRSSSLKVVTLDDSLHSLQKKLPVRSTSLVMLGPPGARSKKKKSLTWKNIEIREYERVCGDNPSCSSGVPMAIGWKYSEAIVLPLVEYEGQRPARRSNHEMLMTRDQRRKMLMNEWDVHPSDIAAAVRANTKVKNRRRKTVNNVGTSASKMEEVAEKLKRNTKRLVFFQPTVSQEAMALTEAAQKAHDQRLDMVASAQVLATAETKSTTTEENDDGEDTFETCPTAAVFVPSPEGSTNSGNEEPSPLSSEVRGVAVIPNNDPVVKAPTKDDDNTSPNKVVPITASAAAAGYAISKVATPKEDAPALSKKAPTAEASGPVTAAKAAAIVSEDGSGGSKSAEKQIVKIVVPAPMFDGLPTPGGDGDDDQSAYELSMLDDDEISQLTEVSVKSINAEAEARRHRLVEEANQRYLETKKIELRILKLEEDKRLAEEAKQKKSWFVIGSPRSPKQQSTAKRGSSPRSSPRSSPKQRSPPKRGGSKKKAPVPVKKAPQRQAVIVEASDDEFST